MSNLSNDHSVRSSARALIEAIDQYDTDGDSQKLRSGLLRATKALTARPDLFKLGAKRQANHIDNSRYLYYDGQLSMTLDEFPNGRTTKAVGCSSSSAACRCHRCRRRSG